MFVTTVANQIILIIIKIPVVSYYEIDTSCSLNSVMDHHFLERRSRKVWGVKSKDRSQPLVSLQCHITRGLGINVASGKDSTIATKRGSHKRKVGQLVKQTSFLGFKVGS